MTAPRRQAPPTPTPATSAFLTPDEVAALLRVDVKTVRRWCADGQVSHALKVGREWRIPRVGLEQFLGRTLASLEPAK